MKSVRLLVMAACLGIRAGAAPEHPTPASPLLQLKQASAQAILEQLGAARDKLWIEPGAKAKSGASQGMAENSVAAAVAAHALGPDKAAEWGAKLYGADTDGRRAFNVLLELLDGQYTHIFDLGLAFEKVVRATRQSVNWHRIAAALRKAAGNDPGRQAWRNTAAGLDLISFVFSNLRSDEKQAAIAGFASAPLDVRKAIADDVVAPRPRKMTPGGNVQNRLWMALKQELFQRRLKEPVLSTLVIRLAPKTLPARALSGIMQQVTMVNPAAGGDAAVAALDRAPDDPRTIIKAAIALAHAGRQDEALDVLRKAEKRLKYPARRDIRLRLFSMLRFNDLAHGARVPPGNVRRGDALDRFPSLKAELEQRRADAAGQSVAELKMVEADLVSIARDMHRAGRLYLAAYTAATDPALKQAAMSALARTDPRTAWKLKKQAPGAAGAGGGQQQPGTKGGAGAGAVTDESFGTTLAAGIADGKIDDALDWAVAELKKGAGAKLTPRFAGTVAAVLVGAGKADSAGAVFPIPEDNKEFLGFTAGMFDVTGRPRYVRLCRNFGLFLKSSRPLAARLDPVPVWLDAVALVTARIPAFSRGFYMGGACMVALSNTPTEPGRPPKDGEVPAGTDAERAKIAAAADGLVKAVLAWVDKHPKDRLAVDRLLSAAGAALRRPRPELFVPTCNRLFIGAIARAPVAGMDTGSVGPSVRAYLNALSACHAPEQATRDVRNALAAAWPNASVPR